MVLTRNGVEIGNSDLLACRRHSMKLQTVLALAFAWLTATGSYSQPQPARARPSQNEPTQREAAKLRLRHVLEQYPDNKEALFELGRLMAEDRDFVSASSLFRKYVVISPAEPGAWAYLVRCAVGQDDAMGAADAQRQIERLAPANLALHVHAACWLAGSAISEVTRHEFELVLSLASDQTSSAGPWYARGGQGSGN